MCPTDTSSSPGWGTGPCGHRPGRAGRACLPASQAWLLKDFERGNKILGAFSEVVVRSGPLVAEGGCEPLLLSPLFPSFPSLSPKGSHGGGAPWKMGLQKASPAEKGPPAPSAPSNIERRSETPLRGICREFASKEGVRQKNRSPFVQEGKVWKAASLPCGIPVSALPVSLLASPGQSCAAWDAFLRVLCCGG